MDDNSDLFSMPEQPKAVQPSAKPAVAAAPIAREEPRPAPKGSDGSDYDASAIEVLEGLEPVRRRPGMYIGGTDEKALHHLFAEVIDNSMDEAVAGHANFIEVHLDADGFLTVTDNGRGIPVENHPKFPGKSTLEVVMTVLHAGGKFDGKAYETSGGLHGVGVSVVNALSDALEVEVARNRKLYRQRFSRGIPQGGLEELGDVHNRRGTRVRFHPDPDIFGPHAHFEPGRLFRMARSKAYLFGGVEIRWSCDPKLIGAKDETPARATFHFPGGLPATAQADVGLAATVTQMEDGVAQLSLRSARLALGVHFEVPGFTADKEHFHLAPDDEVQVTLRGTGVLPTGGLVHALNSIKPARIAPATGCGTEAKN